ncbi:MAG: CidA/LrgA family protein [Candidatus Contendobacter sp.]
MIGALALLLALQLVGEAIVRVSGAPLPGPVVGMVLLFVGLRWREGLPDSLRATTETLLSHLSLLFVPAGVGIVQYGALLAEEWLAILAAVLVSTLLTVAVTALTMQAVIHQRDARRHD